jgi:hypothetical protein
MSARCVPSRLRTTPSTPITTHIFINNITRVPKSFKNSKRSPTKLASKLPALAYCAVAQLIVLSGLCSKCRLRKIRTSPVMSVIVVKVSCGFPKSSYVNVATQPLNIMY